MYERKILRIDFAEIKFNQFLFTVDGITINAKQNN